MPQGNKLKKKLLSIPPWKTRIKIAQKRKPRLLGSKTGANKLCGLQGSLALNN